MLCSGVTEMRVTPEANLFRLGGLDLVNLQDGRPIFQTPILLWTASGFDMTHNPVCMEASDAGHPRLLHAGGRQVHALHLRDRDQIERIPFPGKGEPPAADPTASGVIP